MCAKKQFEELGFKESRNDKYLLEFTHKRFNITIIFNHMKKTVLSSGVLFVLGTYAHREVLWAIDLMKQELGWLDGSK